MSDYSPVSFYVISDSAGTTGLHIAKAAAAQFSDIDFPVISYPFIKTENQLVDILNKAKKEQAVILHTFADHLMVDIMKKYCEKNNLECFDVLTPIIEVIKEKTGQSPAETAGAKHKLDEHYFHRIEALEFAVKYDDGKDPKGFLKADIVLLGISRTSKTPLSIYLANENYKVANLPLMPESTIPDELWQVAPNKIVGLTNSEEVLLSFRQARMRAYGMSPDSSYSSLERIREEIKYADDLYNKLGCLKINVSTKSIEETTAVIIKSLNLKQTFNA